MDATTQSTRHATDATETESCKDGLYPVQRGLSDSALQECQAQFRSTLEDWILVGIKLGHPLPVIAGLDLNNEPMREPVDAV